MNDSEFYRGREFIFGVATSSYQIEGGFDADGRTPSIWDTFCTVPGNVADGSDGKIACAHRDLWDSDAELIGHLGFGAYRLSVSWPRVMRPDGKVNQSGLDFYRRLLDKLKSLDLKVFVNLYHWDLPQWIEDKGGWTTRDTASRFADMADFVSAGLSGTCDAWSTFNEPFCQAYLGYGIGIHAPGKKNMQACFAAGHNQLIAHGKAMQVLRSSTPKTPAGIILNVTPGIAATESPADLAALERWDALNVDWFFSPLFKQAYQPELLAAWGRHMPEIQDGDFALMAQPMDFIGINYYTTERVRHMASEDFEVIRPGGVERTEMGWEVNPGAFSKVLLELNGRYPEMPVVYISENGMASDDVLKDGAVEDPRRIRYIEGHLSALRQAMEKGMDVRGYFVWSLMDNFEWAEGYTKRFGLCYADYPTQSRIPKSSALWMREFMQGG